MKSKLKYPSKDKSHLAWIHTCVIPRRWIELFFWSNISEKKFEGASFNWPRYTTHSKRNEWYQARWIMRGSTATVRLRNQFRAKCAIEYGKDWIFRFVVRRSEVLASLKYQYQVERADAILFWISWPPCDKFSCLSFQVFLVWTWRVSPWILGWNRRYRCAAYARFYLNGRAEWLLIL